MRKKNKTGRFTIAMLGHKRVPSREGGIEVVVEELSLRMVEKGHFVTCFNRKGNHVSGKEYNRRRLREYKGITLKSVPTLDKKGFAAVTSSVFGTIMASFGRYDVLHFHGIGTCLMMGLPKWLNKRCIVSVHGLDHKSPKWHGGAKKYILLSEKCAVKHADEIIVLSESAQNYYWKKYKRKTKLIPNGVKRPVFKRADIIQKTFGLESNDYILYLGRIVPGKGVDDLINAFKGTDRKKKLVIAGGSSDSDDYMQHLIKLSAGEERIIFTGFVEGLLLEELYSNAFLYVLPSELEGMPLSLMEAMSYGNCCLVSDIPECKAVVGEKAMVFQQGNVRDLANKLQVLWDNPEKTMKYREEATDYICSKFNWEDVVEKTLELYGINQRDMRF